jgi:ATP-binding cassette, subfamily B, bacterial MsbA
MNWKQLQQWKSDPLGSLFFEKKRILLAFFVLGLNLFAALFEGGSFGAILFAFSSLNGAESLNLSSYPILRSLPLQNLSQNYLFVLFIISAVLLQTFRSGISYIAQYLTAKLSLKIQMDAQVKVYQQILRFSFPFVSNYKVGDLVKYADAPAAVIPALFFNANQILVSASMILVASGMMLYLNVPLTCLAFFLFSLFAFLQRIIIRKIIELSKNLTIHITDFSKHAVQSLYAIRLIHTFNRQKTIFNKIVDTLKHIVISSQKINLWNNAIPAINEIVGISLVGILLVFGAFFFKESSKNFLPVLLTFLIVSYRLSTKLQFVIAGIGGIATQAGQLIRFKEILEVEGKEFIHSMGKTFSLLRKEIEFRNVSLSYQDIQRNALNNLSFVIPKGKIIALVGSSGAGKSSILDLLVRLYDPSEGMIFVDGVDLRTYELGSWRDQLGVVSQDTFIFNESIQENILFGHLTANSEQVMEAAKLAHAHEFIERMPQGYQTMVGEKGYRLSGGERQRLALARVFLRDPQILILDEATSSLDSHSERLIQDAIEIFIQRKKTIIVVAHRLSTIYKADEILVLNEGELIEKGTHLDLLNKRGSYFNFWSIQSPKTISSKNS